MIETVELSPGYVIPRIVNGGWQLSAGHLMDDDGPDRRQTIEQLLRLADAGLTAFDGADIYTGVEELYGELLRARPGGLRVHTKLVPDLDMLPKISRAYVRGIVDRSLGRLGVSSLDLVQFHSWDFEIDRWLDVVGWMSELRDEGKIRHLGLTNFDTERLRTILDQGFEILSHQVQYSLLDRRPENGMAELCLERGVHLLCYGTLAGGFLSSRWLGRPEPSSVDNRSLVKYKLMIDELGGWDIFQRLLRILDEGARQHGVSIANVATRWVLDRPGVAAAIVGVRGAAHLPDNLRIFDFRLDSGSKALQVFLDEFPGGAGDIYGLEREIGGRHAVIMKTGLNQVD